MQRIAIFFALTNLSSPYHGNCRLVLVSWFPHYPSIMSCRTHPGNQPGPKASWFPSTPPRHLSMAHPGNQPGPRGPWFPTTPPRRLSVAPSGNQVCREVGSGQLGTSGGQCRPGLQTARAGYAARHSGGRPSVGTARRLSFRFWNKQYVSSNADAGPCLFYGDPSFPVPTFPAEAGWMPASDRLDAC